MLGAIVGACVLAAVGVGAASGSLLAARTASAAPPQIRLARPAPGRVTLAAIKIRITGKAARRMPTRPRFDLEKAHASPNVPVLAAVRAKRTNGAITYALLFALVNTGHASARTLSTTLDDTLPPVIQRSGAPCNRTATHNWAGVNTVAAVTDTLFFAHHRSAIAYFDISTQDCFISMVEIRNVNSGTSFQRAQDKLALDGFFRSQPALGFGLRDITNTLPGFEVGRYDIGHLSGWKFGDPATEDAMRYSWSLVTVPQSSLDETFTRIVEALGATITPPPPPPSQVQITEFDTWAHNTEIHKSNICINVETTPPQASISATITGPSNYKATLPITPLHPDGTRQVGAQINQSGDYTKTLTVYDATGKQTATVTKTFTVLPPPPDGPQAGPVPPFGPPCSVPTG